MHFLVSKLSGGGREGGEEHKGFVLFSAFKSEFSLVKSVPIKGNEIPPAFMSFLFCPHNKKTLDYYFTVKNVSFYGSHQRILMEFHIPGFNFHIHTLMNPIQASLSISRNPGLDIIKYLSQGQC